MMSTPHDRQKKQGFCMAASPGTAWYPYSRAKSRGVPASQDANSVLAGRFRGGG